MLSTNLPGVSTALVDQPDAAIVPEFYLPHQVTQPMVDSSANTAFDFGRPDLNSARNNADVSSFDDQQLPRTLVFNRLSRLNMTSMCSAFTLLPSMTLSGSHRCQAARIPSHPHSHFQLLILVKKSNPHFRL
jgi:hypothetical protein